MNSRKSEKTIVLQRTVLIVVMIVIAAALRLAPHPWNFTPLGAIAIFSGATVRDRQFAFCFPLAVMLASDAIIGFNTLSLLVYASFLLSVLIGRAVAAGRPSGSPRAKPESEADFAATSRDNRLLRIAAATFLGSLQFFLITNFGVWALLGTYSKTGAGLVTCYVAGLPLFRNMLAGDAIYATLLFGGFFLAERLWLHSHEVSSTTM